MTKKIIALLLAALLMAGATAALAETIHFSGDCFVRSGPSLGYAKLGVAHQGSTLTGTGETSTDSRGVKWYRVKYGSGKGWVSSVYAYTGGSGSKNRVVADGGDSFVRSGPGRDYSELGVLEMGSSAKYLEKYSTDYRGVKWYKISWGSGTGWVSEMYTSLKKGGGGSSDKVVADGGDCYVRTGPGLGYADIGVLYEGETVKYDGKTSTDSRGVKWYRVDYDGDIGWVSSKYATRY